MFTLLLREDGLSWIILMLSKLGKCTSEQDLPDFLDSKAKNYISSVFFK